MVLSLAPFLKEREIQIRKIFWIVLVNKTHKSTFLIISAEKISYLRKSFVNQIFVLCLFTLVKRYNTLPFHFPCSYSFQSLGLVVCSKSDWLYGKVQMDHIITCNFDFGLKSEDRTGIFHPGFFHSWDFPLLKLPLGSNLGFSTLAFSTMGFSTLYLNLLLSIIHVSDIA